MAVNKKVATMVVKKAVHTETKVKVVDMLMKRAMLTINRKMVDMKAIAKMQERKLTNKVATRKARATMVLMVLSLPKIDLVT